MILANEFVFSNCSWQNGSKKKNKLFMANNSKKLQVHEIGEEAAYLNAICTVT